jgi:hypothetical protein
LPVANHSYFNKNIPSLLEDANTAFQGLCNTFQQIQTPQQPAIVNLITPPSTLHQHPQFLDPKPFDRIHSLYPIFKQKAKAKIHADGAIYGLEQGQVNYLFSRLINMAARTILPWLNSYALLTIEEF